MSVTDHPRSLKMALSERLDTVSYSHSVITMAISLATSVIFSVKQCPDLEIWVWGRSRSSKMVLLDRSYTATFYWSGIVTIAISCTILELFGVK